MSGSLRVLVVDDDVRSARVLGRMLRDDGLEVEVAADGAAAIGRLARDPVPDVVVTALMVPHVSGQAIASYARARSADVRIVFVTRYPGLAPDLDRSAVLAKPVDYAALYEAITSAVLSAAQ